MLNWFASDSFEKERPQWLEKIFCDINTLKSGAIGKAIVSLYNLKKAKDIHYDSEEVGAHRSDCDLHHIFPKAAIREYLMTEKKIQDRVSADKILKKDFNIDSVLNQTWLLSKTNQNLIGSKNPSEYLKELIDQNGGGANGRKKVQSLFNDHCVSEKCFEYLLSNKYFDFIEERRKDIHRELMTTCHIPEIIESDADEDEGEV
jgi:hypothetical protein